MKKSFGIIKTVIFKPQMSGLSVHNALYAVFNRQTITHSDICQHLKYLLNARQGCLVAVPDYGLPELGVVFRYLPQALYDFLKTVKETIEVFEPRLKNVRVEVAEGICRSEILQLHIIAKDVFHQTLTFKAIINQFEGVVVM